MPNSDKNIIIVPNTNQSGLPNIQFVGSSSAPISLNVLDDNTVSFSGSQGQLFAINNNLTSGTIFSVNDVSGIPMLEVNASGTVSMARFGTGVAIGKSTTNARLDISGSTVVTGALTVVGTISASNYLGISGGGGTPGGTNTTIQFNSGSTFSGSTNLIYNYTSNILEVSGQIRTIGGGNSLQMWKDSSATKALNIGLVVPGGAVTDDATFSLYDGSTWNERLRITNGGNVGIGTSTPTEKLHIKNTGSVYTLVENTVNTGYSSVQVKNDTGSYVQLISVASSQTGTWFGGDNAPLSRTNTVGFRTGGSESALLFAAQGNVPLHIGQNDTTRLLFNTSEASFNHNKLNYNFRVAGDNDDNVLFVSASTDRIGIGKSTPNAKLDVNGSVIITGSLTTTDTNSSIAFSASNSLHWSGTLPVTLQEALNRIAAAIYSGTTGSIA